MSDCTVYIDESGDLGAHKGTQWFVLTAVVVSKSDEVRIRTKMAQIKAKLNVMEIHLKNIRNYYKRAYIVRELGEEPFTYMNVLVDTTKFDSSKIPSPVIAYNYICKYLLQRVSWYLTENHKTADLVLSARGTSRDGDLLHYISDKLLPYPSNGIESTAFGTISAKAASSWDLLQLADVCATTLFLTYEVNEYGFCTPCFSLALRDHLYKKNDRLDSYGIKFFQEEMRPSVFDIRSMRVCAKKQEPPARLPHDKHAG